MNARVLLLLLLPLAGFAAGCQSNPVAVNAAEPQVRQYIVSRGYGYRSEENKQRLDAIADEFAQLPGVIEVTAGEHLYKDYKNDDGDRRFAYVLTIASESALQTLEASERYRALLGELQFDHLPASTESMRVTVVGTGVEVSQDNRTRRDQAQRAVRETTGRGRGS